MSYINRATEKLSHLRWLMSAWTIDHIDSPLLRDFYDHVVACEAHISYKTEERLALALRSYFGPAYLIAYQPTTFSPLFLEKISSDLERLSIVEDLSPKVNNGDHMIVKTKSQSQHISRVTPLLVQREVRIPEEMKLERNVRIDLWYFKAYWYDHRVKEAIDINLSPYPKRWKLGVSRPLAEKS